MISAGDRNTAGAILSDHPRRNRFSLDFAIILLTAMLTSYTCACQKVVVIVSFDYMIASALQT